MNKEEKKPISFLDIKQMTRANYVVNIFWKDLPKYLDRLKDEDNLNMSPEYQRGYVWSEKQKIAFIEYCLKGGRSWLNIYLNSPNWMWAFKEGAIMEIVDWKQRISAVLDFLDNKIKVFWYYHKEYWGKVYCDFIININNLSSDLEVVNWYLDMNTWWSAHTDEDLKSAYDFKINITN